MTTADLQQRVQAECGDMGVKVLDRVQKGASYDEINFFFGEAGVSMAFAIKEMTEKGSGYAGLNNIDLVALSSLTHDTRQQRQIIWRDPR